jgi:hypothetical protein
VIAPVFLLDSREQWRPASIETLGAVGAKVVTDRGATHFKSAADLPPEGGRLDLPADMKQPDVPPVGYVRVLAGKPLVWVQHWLFYLYNPGPPSLRGIGRHEGDWEFVQVGYTDATLKLPVLVTASQHRQGEKRESWRCELHDGRLVVYVARGSHANYLQPTRDATDVADGAGARLDTIEWREFGAWASWPGRWGNSTGEGQSPRSPGCQLERWKSPHRWHGAGRAG